MSSSHGSESAYLEREDEDEDDDEWHESYNSFRRRSTQDRIAEVESRNSELESRNAVLERPARACSSLLFTERFSDLVFICSGGERIHAHRNIVAACSEHLSALLQGQWAETAGTTPEIKMDQSDVSVRALLRFMYTGHVDDAALDANLDEVLELAAQHGLTELIEACEEHAIYSLTVGTVVNMINLAYTHSLLHLKFACVQVVKKNMAQVLMSLPFMALKDTHHELWKEMRVELGLAANEGEHNHSQPVYFHRKLKRGRSHAD